MSQTVRKKFVNPYSSALDAEFQHIQRTTTERRRITPRKGESWLIRILPAQLGDSGLWFARVAKHWLNKKPITCPRHTHPHYGGHPDAPCPVCDAVDELNASSDESIRNKAWESRSTTQWLVYALVYEKTVNGQEITLSPEEQLIPYEFQMYKGTWEELVAFFKAGGRPDNPLSVLDLIAGNDFMLTKIGNKPLRLDKQDSRPILDDLFDPPEEDERVVKMMKACPAPRVVIPTDQQLAVFADKLHDYCLGGDGGGVDGGDEQGPDDPVGRRSTTRTTSTSRRRAEPAEEPDGGAEDGGAEDGGAEEPARAPARRPVAAAPAGRRASTPPAETEEPGEGAGDTDAVGAGADGTGDEQGAEPMDEADGAEVPPAAPQAAARRAAPAAQAARTAPAAAPAAQRGAPRQTAPPARAAAPARAAKAPTGQVDDDPSDPLPEADRDSVDPASEPVAGTTTRRTAAPPTAAPPAVARAGGNALRSNVASRVSAATAAAARGGAPRK